MGFYEELSRYYDQIFPVDATEMAFVVGQLEGAGRLLDIGCGTGNKTVHCADGAGEIAAVDLDPGMIARAKADNARPNIRYEVLDMRSVKEHFQGRTFDGILCLGNTLVHLDGPAEISAFLEDVSALLAPGGVLILQILNYDRILRENVRSLPPLDSAPVLFERAYRPEGAKMHFLTRITLKQSGQSFDNDVLLYPLRRQELADALSGAGFREPAWFGGYSGAPLEDSSFALIAVCRK